MIGPSWSPSPEKPIFAKPTHNLINYPSLRTEGERVATRNEVVEYLLQTHYNGDVGRLANATGFSQQQINGWVCQQGTPRASSVDWIMHKTFAPEFRVIAEYKPIEAPKAGYTIAQQLRAILSGHETASGLYAFYDSMASLIYLGKSDGNLFNECNQQLNAELKRRIFPKGASQPSSRTGVVRYVSAYYVQASDFADYAKHVESLILRISKPILNANIGVLQTAKVPGLS